jgi:hypothetical protein
MVKKICKKIGKFLIYCLELAEYNKPVEEKKVEKKKSDNLVITDKVMQEWLYGEQKVGSK